MIISASNANKSKIICKGMPLLNISPKADLESLTSIISWGRSNGIPKMANRDAF